MSFLARLSDTVTRYLAEVAEPREHLALLRWQIGQGHALDQRTTFPGHVTTSAIILTSDHSQVLLIDHVVIGRWLQPGGHYEPAELFHLSAAREAREETAVSGLRLHPWHGGGDIPSSSTAMRCRASRRGANRLISITICNISSSRMAIEGSARKSRRCMRRPGNRSLNWTKSHLAPCEDCRNHRRSCRNRVLATTVTYLNLPLRHLIWR